jgi:hypothetical protein
MALVGDRNGGLTRCKVRSAGHLSGLDQFRASSLIWRALSFEIRKTRAVEIDIVSIACCSAPMCGETKGG